MSGRRGRKGRAAQQTKLIAPAEPEPAVSGHALQEHALELQNPVPPAPPSPAAALISKSKAVLSPFIARQPGGGPTGPAALHSIPEDAPPGGGRRAAEQASTPPKPPPAPVLSDEEEDDFLMDTPVPLWRRCQLQLRGCRQSSGPGGQHGQPSSPGGGNAAGGILLLLLAATALVAAGVLVGMQHVETAAQRHAVGGQAAALEQLRAQMAQVRRHCLPPPPPPTPVVSSAWHRPWLGGGAST